jgi:hypothetical protein
LRKAYACAGTKESAAPFIIGLFETLAMDIAPIKTPRDYRPLTLKMIWRLHEGPGIPAESLIRSR